MLRAYKRQGCGRHLGPAVAVLLVATLVFSQAAAAPVAQAPGRFSMTPTDDGFLRLDTVTGAVSMCRKHAQTWRCTLVEDEALALQREVERLRKENEALRARALLPPSEGAPGEPGRSLDLPSKEEVDKAMDFLEDILRRFKGLLQPPPPTEEEEGTPL